MPAAYEARDIQLMFQRVNERIRAIEEQVALLSEKAGVPYEQPTDGAPKEVVELARAGKTMEAITKYRELTQADFATAKEAVEAI